MINSILHFRTIITTIIVIPILSSCISNDRNDNFDRLRSTNWKEKYFNYETGRSYIDFAEDGKSGTYFQATSTGCFYEIGFICDADSLLFNSNQQMRYEIGGEEFVLYIPYLDPSNDVTRPLKFVNVNLDSVNLEVCE